MTKLLIYFGIFFIVLMFEAMLSWFCFCECELDKGSGTNIISALTVIAFTNATVISIIAVKYFI